MFATGLDEHEGNPPMEDVVSVLNDDTYTKHPTVPVYQNTWNEYQILNPVMRLIEHDLVLEGTAD